MFIWQPGEYEVTIAVDSVPKQKGADRTYRFTLFESDAAELAAIKDNFSIGDGIFWDSRNYTGVGVPLVEA